MIRFAAILCLFGAGGFLGPAQAGTETLPLPPVRISIIGTGDFHGALETKHAKVLGGREVGGIDVIAAYIEALRATNPEGVLLLDAGDLYQGTLISAASEGQTVVEFYNDLGYDAVAVGNHDFDFGPVGYHSIPTNPEEDPLGVIKLRIREAHFPFLGANIYDRTTSKPVSWKNLKSYAILKRKGIKIGVVGLTPVNTALITHPANVRTLEFRPLLPTLRRLLPEIRSQGATVVIVVMHAGVQVDEETGEVSGPVADLARSLEPGEVDLILTGHLHMPFSDRINNIPVVQPWSSGISFVRVDLMVDQTSGCVRHDKVVIHENTFFFRTDRNGKPPTFAGRIIWPVDRFVKKLKQFKRSVAHLERIRLGRALKKLQHRAKWDSPVGNLVCDAMRATDKSIDVAMYNSGGLRNYIPKGIITFGRVYEVVPFDNSLVTLTMTGKQIREVLEHGLAAPYGIMEISGLKVCIDADAPPGQRCVSIVTSSGEEVVNHKLYNVATNEFVLNGGDGYYAFSRGTNVHNTRTLIREVLASYIKQKGNVAPDDGGRYKLCKRVNDKKP